MKDQQLFSDAETRMDSPRLAWMKEHRLHCFATDADAIEDYTAGYDDELAPFACCTDDEMYRLSYRATGFGNTEEEACDDWARKHHVKTWNE